jgi:polyisoprenoid-binding protein YceI
METMTTAGDNNVRLSGQAKATALAGPAKWELDPGASAVTFGHKTLWGLSTVRGEFSDFSGTAEILADGSAHGRLEIGSASVNTKNRKRDQHLRSADFFHAAAHPTIVVDVAEARSTDGRAVQASGMLTVAGRTRPLTVTAAITEADDQGITLIADTEIDRTDFSLTWNQLGMLRGPARVHVVARFVKPAAG